MTATNECKGFRKSTLAEFRADPVGFLRRAADSLEPTAQFKIGGRTLVLLKDAADIEELFVKKQLSFQKGPGLLRLRQVLGDSLLTSDDSTHANNRRHFQPAFSIPKVADYGASMPILAHELTADWRSGETVDVLREMSRMTLAILAATVFNSTAKPDHESIGAAISDNINANQPPANFDTAYV
jgi:cytochrome P450